MIKSIKLYNRFNMDCFASTEGLNFPYNHWYLVSIYGNPEKPLMVENTGSVFKKLGLQKYVSLNFWDLDDREFNKIKPQYPNATIFNREHANKIIRLLHMAQKDKKDSALVVHCAAGISRSAAVGTFACDYCKLDYAEFVKENPSIYSNQYVLNILRRQANLLPFSGIMSDGIDWASIDEHFGIERFKRLVLKKKD